MQNYPGQQPPEPPPNQSQPLQYPTEPYPYSQTHTTPIPPNPYSSGGFPPAPPPRQDRAHRFLAWYRRQPLFMKLLVWAGVIFVGLAVISGTVQGIQQSVSPTPTPTTVAGSQVTPTQATQPTSTPKPTAVVSHYPPKTKADLQALAALGDANAIQGFHSKSVGFTGVCPQPQKLVTVDPSITGKRLAEDLLAYFFGNQLANPCGAVVFAYHTQAEANGNGYTAGRVLLDTGGNTDPNATNITYTLTLDLGNIPEGEQEYVVSWKS